MTTHRNLCLGFIRILLLIGLSFQLPALKAGSILFNYTLPAAATTSAGVFAADGTLLHTLWSNQSDPAGVNSAVWDGLDDDGQPMSPGTYTVKVLQSQISYTWEGTLGNTSTAQTGPTVRRAFFPIYDLAITGNNMVIPVGYNEGGALFHRSSTATPNTVDYYSIDDYKLAFMHVATDGTRAYFGNYRDNGHFVTAFNLSDNSVYPFSSGVVDPTGRWLKVIDLAVGANLGPTGIAVQTSGNYLFVAHEGSNEIRVFNKLTGASVSTAAVTSPGKIVLTTDGTGLWVICTESGDRVVRRYTVDGAGNLTPDTPVVIGLSSPLALAISPDNNTLLVADGGTSQQVKAWSNVSSGTPVSLWTLGQTGGYNAVNGPAVANDKFYFMLNNQGDELKGTYLAFQSDGSFWVGDPGNERSLRFSSTRMYLDQIMYLSHNYVSEACLDDPTRVFARGWLEFAVDYSQPVKQGWTLVNNWAAGLPEADATLESGGFQIVKKMSNGRTYGVANKKVYELLSTGLRYTGTTLPTSPNQQMHDDGSLRWAVQTNAALMTYYQKPLTGFDGANNPVWGSQVVLATSPVTSTNPETNTGGRGMKGVLHPSTSTGLMIVSDTRGSGRFPYHLGAIAEGGTDWKWKTARGGRYFDGHGSVSAYCWYACNNAYVSGRHIILGAHGEGYIDPYQRAGQAGQFLHYWDDGLMIGQFGSALNEPVPPPEGSGVIARRAGNAFSPRLIQVGADLYFWVNDEFSSSGLHRWKINNPASVSELTVSVNLPSGSNGTGLTGQYFSGSNFDTPVSQGTDLAVNFNWGAASPGAGIPADNFSVRWTGLIEPRYSENYTFTVAKEDYARLWINGALVADGWSTSGGSATGSVALTAGQKYNLLLEYRETTGNAKVSLKWQSASQALEVVPYRQLYPSDAYAFNMGATGIGRFVTDPLGIPVGSKYTTTLPVSTTGVYDAAPMAVYQQARHSGGIDFGLIDLAPFTNYRIRTHLAEIHPSYQGANLRKFKATAPSVGTISDVLTGIDIFTLAGGGYKAVVQDTVMTTDASGHLRLGYKSDPQPALIAAVEIVRDAGSDPVFGTSGKGSGLKGEYYSGTAFNTLVTTRIDPEINFVWACGVAPAPGVPSTNYTVRWTGQVLSIEGGSYTFNLAHDNGARLWVNGVLIVDQWAATGTHTGIITLAPCTKYSIQLEYLQTTAAANVTLKWQRPESTWDIIPRSQFYPPAYATPEIILDNADAGVTKVGSWIPSTGNTGQYYGANHYHDGNTGKGTKTVRFTPTLPLTGLYEVFIRQTADATRSTAVPTTITHASGTATFSVNQQLNGAEWVSFGTYQFNAGTAGYVTISNTGTTGYVDADAVKFVKR